MIVSCPSCNVRYRHEVVSAAAVTARCSGCDATFELGAPRPAYRLVPRTASAMALPAGSLGLSTPEATIASGAPGSRSRTRPSAWGMALALLLAGVATASGYYLSLLEITDTMTGTASGAGIGAVLAWAVIRWTRRAR